jgi:hypothetical protein
MSRIALVASNGEITSLITMTTHLDYTEGQVLDPENTVRFLPDTATSNVLTTWYWDGEWKTDKPVKPSENHYWVNNAWELDLTMMWIRVKTERSQRLTGCDWTQLPDSPLTETNKALWATYRQELRDITATYASATSKDDIIWPTQP